MNGNLRYGPAMPIRALEQAKDTREQAEVVCEIEVHEQPKRKLETGEIYVDEAPKSRGMVMLN